MQYSLRSIPTHAVDRDLFAFVEDSIKHARDTVLVREPETLLRLSNAGYLGFGEDAFRDYLKTYETITCPHEVEVWAKRFPDRIEWKRASGFLAACNRSFPELGIALMTDDAHPRSWFHEMAHIVFRHIPKPRREALTCATAAIYPTVSSPADESELCLKIGDHLAAFNHHGAEGEDHEVLAIVFAEHCCGFKLHRDVRRQLERIIEFYALS
jgi:hypothetical protein